MKGHTEMKEQNVMKKTLLTEGDGRSEVHATRAGTPFGPFSPSPLCEGVKKRRQIGRSNGGKTQTSRDEDTSH